MTVQEAPDQTARSLEGSCPTCGAPAERGQLVCLECGSRIALAYKRPPSWKIPIVILLVLGTLVVAGAVLAYEAIDDDAKDEVAATPLKPKQAQTSDRRPQTSERRAKPEPKTDPRPATTPEGLVPKGKLYTWPKGLRAFTVVLLSTEDRASATSYANSVAGARDAKVGVIRADDFETLPKGFFVVFGGSYETRARADRAAARLGAKYQGAFAQLVRR